MERRPPARRALPLALGGLVFLLFVGCGTLPPAPWPWWTSEDSAAVQVALDEWRGTLNAANSLDGFRASPEGWQTQLASRDSTSETGDTLYKFGHILSLSYAVTDSGHADVLEFGPSVDTLEMTDTFCFVSYYDSMVDCHLTFEYDSLWVIGYEPDTEIVGSPPETLVAWNLSYAELRGFDSPQQATKSYAWKAFRGLHLPKDGPDYMLTRMTGFEVHIPSAEDAPDVSRVIMTRPGGTDTVFDRPTEDIRGLMNLHALDSLYHFEQGTEVQLRVELRTTDEALFFAGVGGDWSDITAGATLGEGPVTMSDTGYQHIFVEVLPTGMMYYPDADHYVTVWAIPVRVEAP